MFEQWRILQTKPKPKSFGCQSTEIENIFWPRRFWLRNRTTHSTCQHIWPLWTPFPASQGFFLFVPLSFGPHSKDSHLTWPYIVYYYACSARQWPEEYSKHLATHCPFRQHRTTSHISRQQENPRRWRWRRGKMYSWPPKLYNLSLHIKSHRKLGKKARKVEAATTTALKWTDIDTGICELLGEHILYRGNFYGPGMENHILSGVSYREISKGNMSGLKKIIFLIVMFIPDKYL